MTQTDRQEPDRSDTGSQGAKVRDDAAPRRYFERPAADEQPLTLRETLGIVLATHLGVRTRARRESDFRRANGLHLFVAGVIYFLLLVGLLVLLANSLSG